MNDAFTALADPGVPELERIVGHRHEADAGWTLRFEEILQARSPFGPRLAHHVLAVEMQEVERGKGHDPVGPVARLEHAADALVAVGGDRLAVEDRGVDGPGQGPEPREAGMAEEVTTRPRGDGQHERPPEAVTPPLASRQLDVICHTQTQAALLQASIRRGMLSFPGVTETITGEGSEAPRRHQVGHLVDITYTQALAISLDKQAN